MKGIGKGLIVGVLAVCLSGTAQGQSSEDGTVAVHGLSVSRADDRLFVSMEMDISDLHVGRDRELVVTPRLVGEGDSLCLPSVLIAGRRRYYHHLRNGVEESTQLYRLGEASVVEYRAVVPYRSWMGRAQLSAVEELRGCCSMPVAVGESGLLRLDLEPRVFVPVYVYLRPQAAPKISVCEGSAYIDFPVSRTELYEDYRRNPEELGKILATIDAIRADEDTRILSVSIKGYASPESPYANNERLARGRTQTLKEYVQRQYDFPDSLLTTSYEAEDWDGLERWVEGSSLQHREEILALIRSDLAPDTKENRIRQRYPEDYRYLLRNVYPGLRHSNYAVKYEVRSYTDVAEIRELLRTQPQKLSLNEMYLAAQEMEPGSEEYNETFAIAVRMFPQDEVANLNAANTALRLGDLAGAERYLAKAGQAAEAVYARGLHAALSGDYAQARVLFGEAAAGGIAQAEEMLRQLEELER